MSYNQLMVKQTMVRSYYGIPLSNTKKWTIDTHNNLGGSQGHYAEWWGKGQPVSTITYSMIPFVRNSQNNKNTDMENRLVAAMC